MINQSKKALQKIFICVTMLLLLSQTQETKPSHFLFLDLSNETIRGEIWENFKKIENITERENSTEDNETTDNGSLSVFEEMLARFDNNESISKTEYSLMIDIICQSEILTEIFYNNFAGSPQFKVFANIVDKEIQKKVLSIFKENLILLRALREESFLKDDGNRKILLEHFFKQGVVEINRVLLKNVNLEFFKNQRCVLKRVIELRNLRDLGQYELTEKQKEMLIPIILKENSMWQPMLEDKELVAI